MKKTLIALFLVLLLIALVGVAALEIHSDRPVEKTRLEEDAAAKCDGEGAPMQFDSVESLRDRMETISDDEDDVDLTALKEIAMLSAIPEGFELDRIYVTKDKVSCRYTSQGSLAEEQHASLLNKQCYELVTDRDDRTLLELVKRYEGKEEDIINGTYYIANWGNRALLWEAHGEVYELIVPADVIISEEDVAQYCRIELVDVKG